MRAALVALLLAVIGTPITRPVYADYALSGELELSVGQRVDSLHWSIAGDQGDPNVISELTWSELRSYPLATQGRLRFANGVVVAGEFAYGSINDGEVRDSDYESNDRQGEFSRSESHSGGDYVADLALGVGYRFSIPAELLGRPLHLTPMVGESIHWQQVEMTRGVQTLSNYSARFDYSPPEEGSELFGLNSQFRTKWNGLWLGGEAALEINGETSLTLGWRYHQLNYYAEADWNLRHDLDHPRSFAQHANATGRAFSVKLQHLLNKRWNLSLHYGESWWETESGNQDFYRSNGTLLSRQRLNRSEWHSQQIMVGLRLRL